MRFFSFLVVAMLLFPAAGWAQTAVLETPAREAMIVDFQTGQVLFEKEPDMKIPTASMSKTMTMYLVFEALKEGKLTLDQQLPVSEKAWRMQGSKMFVDLNSLVKVEDLVRGVIVQSGNDATIVLAEGLAGSELEFASQMNKKAQELGMTSSHFMNASGWPDPEHYSTARDLVTLGMAMIKNHPEYYKYYSEKEFTYNNIKQGNRNPLLYKNIGADGIKTGHTEEAGYGLMASAVRGNRRVVMMVGGLKDMEERSNEATRLMEWALTNFENKTLFKPEQIVTDADVAMGMEKKVPLIVNQDVTVTLPRIGAGNISAQAVYKGPLEAPVKKGDQVGVVRVTIPNMQAIEIPLLAGKDIPRLGFFPSIVEKARRLVVGDQSPIKEKLTTPVGE